MSRFKEIIGGTEEEAYEKFPWLREAEFAEFEEAVVDIRNEYLIWKSGIWYSGVWKGGYWEGGTWKGGIWVEGIWQDGVWENGIWYSGTWISGVWEGGEWKKGEMWSNIDQKFYNVKQVDGKFVIIN